MPAPWSATHPHTSRSSDDGFWAFVDREIEGAAGMRPGPDALDPDMTCWAKVIMPFAHTRGGIVVIL